MAALEKNGYPADRAAVSAIEAGVSVLIVSEKRFLPLLDAIAARCAYDTDFRSLVSDAVMRVLKFKIKSGILEYTGPFFHPDGIAVRTQ
jgi:beta-N-acetylhexosaminidase